MMNLTRYSLRTLLIATMSGLVTGHAWAFSEDVCPDNNGGWKSCVTRDCEPGGENLVCQNQTMISQYITNATSTSKDGMRSTIHLDATYLLAQAAGFNPREAFEIAKYDEALDVGRYLHRDEAGELLADPVACASSTPPAACQFNSLDVAGLDRNNFIAGGLFFHFHAHSVSQPKPDGLHPVPTQAESENFLYGLRQWVRGLAPLCVAGLTMPDGSCYQSKVRSETTLLGRIPFISELLFAGSVDWVSPLGEQQVIRDPVTQEMTPASAFDSYFPKGKAAFARLGIYLHATQDRISHHRCVIRSNIVGPRAPEATPILANIALFPSYDLLIYRDPQDFLQQLAASQVLVNPEFLYEFDNQDCDQPKHFQRHSFETGTPQESLDPQDRTTEAGLTLALEELRFFAGEFGIPSKSLTVAETAALMSEIITALETPDANARIRNLTAVATRNRLLPLPGHGDIPLADWDSQAGSIRSTASARDDISIIEQRSGSGSMNGFSLLILAFMTLMFRRSQNQHST